MNEQKKNASQLEGKQAKARYTLAYDLLRQRIKEGELRPGDHIAESELAQELGLSRTPVREAIKLLQAEGMLEPSPGRGLTVATLSIEEASQLFHIREVIEGLGARLAAVHASANDIEEMSTLLKKEEVTPETEGAALLAINNKFHSVIHRSSRNQYILQSMHTYESAMILLRQMTRIQFKPSANAYSHHLAIFQAIEREDPVAAENAMRQHIRFSRRKRLFLLEESFAKQGI